MNLSDTSRESSDNSSRFEEVENDIEHQTLNISVTSSIQSSTNRDGLNVQDLVAENRRLTQENDDLKRRIADLEAAGGGGGKLPFLLTAMCTNKTVFSDKCSAKSCRLLQFSNQKKLPLSTFLRVHRSAGVTFNRGTFCGRLNGFEETEEGQGRA